MTKIVLIWVFVLPFFLGSSLGTSQSAFLEGTNPYIQLYLKRFEVAKLELEQRQVQWKFEESKLKKLKWLVSQGVISKQQVEAQDVKVKQAEQEIAESQAMLAETQALYNINKLRIENGLEVSVCPEGE